MTQMPRTSQWSLARSPVTLIRGSASPASRADRERQYLPYRSEIATPAAATANALPLLIEMGCPVQDPNIHLTGDPARSHSSSPTMLHVPPDPFVHDAVEEFDVAA